MARQRCPAQRDDVSNTDGGSHEEAQDSPRTAAEGEAPPLSDEKLDQMERETPLIHKRLLVQATRLVEQQRGHRLGPAPETEEEMDAYLRAAGADVDRSLQRAMDSIAEEKARRLAAKVAAAEGLIARIEAIEDRAPVEEMVEVIRSIAAKHPLVAEHLARNPGWSERPREEVRLYCDEVLDMVKDGDEP